MVLLYASFVAGFLTVLAPCILPVLPVVLAGSVTESRRTKRIVTIIFGLTISVVVFSLLLKATTSLLGIPQIVWQLISGGILILFGVVSLYPGLWEKVSAPLGAKAGESLQTSRTKSGLWGDLFLGAALGPVFNSCSPTYALIVAAILPVSFGRGLTYLVSYAIGLAVALLLIAFLGRALVSKLGWAANPTGWFHKVIGVLLIVIGLAVIFGADKKFQTYVLDRGYYQPIINLEEQLRLPK
ncbi:MAG: sulfite exporter TauE/SafE family protein [Candidatus Berkelbacteria bacterium]|nr:MAG: sulfite exporter TauE/SafE family protein [Candidatus Berkelbacteria bacterium]QQG51969.1 MAG: sulfite exporter TauE/SafE family protein [Candidatus Berkelbacteria bacterium]